ncbi:MAG: transcriptional repressor [Clostridiales bacterium]|nr:transcriptional repressor [Clostridiales bacterium]
MQERQTKQKQIIYDALKTLNHPTATEVYGYVRENNPTVSRATVFRVLGGFATSGRALELRTAGSEIRYDYNVTPHCHGRCLCCGKLADVWVEGLPEKGILAQGQDEFEVESYALEFFGRCAECKKEEKKC